MIFPYLFSLTEEISFAALTLRFFIATEMLFDSFIVAYINGIRSAAALSKQHPQLQIQDEVPISKQDPGQY